MGKQNLFTTKTTLKDYFISNWKWCLLALLLISEIIIFTWQNSTVDDSFLAYLVERANFKGSVFLFILFGNTRSALCLVLMGIIPFGLGSLFNAFGALENIVLTIKYLLPAVGTKQLILSTITHGIFEATALYLSFVCSILLSKAITSSILSRMTNKKKEVSLFEECKVIFKGIIYVLLPLILIAAVLEVTVSW